MSPESFRPSKQFLVRGAIAVSVIAVVLVVQTTWFQTFIHNLFHKKAPATDQKALTVGDLVLKDTNGNGIPDWEERLWGLDPTVLYTDGKPNAQIIKEKKIALGATDTATGAPLNETDVIAQKLFGITTALSQNSDISDASVQDIATKLGSSITTPTISNSYSLKNISTVPTNSATLTTYYNTLNSIMGKYDLTQEDVTIIATAVETGDYSQLSVLAQTQATYVTIAKQLSAMKVPLGVAQYHLDIINSFAGMANSFTYIMQMQNNGTQSLVGVTLYKLYNTRGQSALYDLHIYLIKYGILTS